MNGKINFGDLVLKGGGADTVQKETPKKKKKAAAPVFECVANSGADFVIKRTTATTSRLLVMLVSQEQYYVKNELTGEIDMLTQKVLDAFFQGFAENSLHIGCSWLERFSNSKAAREALVRLIKTAGFKQAAIYGLVDFEKFFDYRGHFNKRAAALCIEKLSCCTDASAALMKHIGEVAASLPCNQKEFLVLNAEPLLTVFKTYGLDRAREFVNRFAECSAFEDASGARDVSLRSLSELLSIVPTRDGIVAGSYKVSQHAYGAPVSFQFDKLCGYLFDQSAREGFTDLEHWLSTWKDTLLLQLYVEDKIVDKYPSNLLSVHQVLSTEAARMQKAIDQVRWDEAETAMRDFDFAPKGSKYLATHPVTPEDMRAEAVAQSNCLAGYVNKVLARRCMIFFVRNAASPEKSLLTVEVNSARELVQVKARSNHEADDDSMQFVARWCREKGIALGMYADRVAELPELQAA